MSRRIWLIAAMWIMWFIRRFPARDSRCRFCSPDDASKGAVPVSRLAGREPVAVGEPGDVADVGQGPGRDDRPDPGQVHQL